LENAIVIRIEILDSISYSYLKKATLQRSLFDYFSTSSSSSVTSVLRGLIGESILYALPLNDQNFYLISSKCIQKWSFSGDLFSRGSGPSSSAETV
jgi:hypothetical protein